MAELDTGVPYIAYTNNDFANIKKYETSFLDWNTIGDANFAQANYLSLTKTNNGKIYTSFTDLAHDNKTTVMKLGYN